ncbi:hemicentin-1-like [Misgurnus anguillicaudatus]|uniref:hemicentin-1-like n=1 Tax=Misgurnus anguillicaudatus TaxID=75329 RepID=UPI003CCFAD77
MKHLLFFCFALLLDGVSGTVVTVSVNGDSFTLPIKTDEIKGAENLLWKFKGEIIATIDSEDENSKAEYPDGGFNSRLKLDRTTGSLTINKITTEDNGEYQLEIRSSRTPGYKPLKTFSVTVTDGVKSESWMEGGTVILNTEAKTQPDDVIEWKFKNTPIAKMDRTVHPHPEHVLVDSFKGRLHVDLFGSLIITHIKTKDSGLYDVKITNSNHIIQKRFRVTVNVPSSRSHQVKIGPGLFLVLIMLVIALV